MSDIEQRLRAIDEVAMYEAPATTEAIIREAADELARLEADERKIAELEMERDDLAQRAAVIDEALTNAVQLRTAAEADKARLSEALRPFADMADYLDSETEGFSETDEFDLLYEDHLFHHFKVADFRIARAALSGSGDGWSKAADDVLAERRRQIEAEDFDASHDDMATKGQLAGAAACYAMADIEHWAAKQAIKTIWPWADEWWKPSDRRRNLVKAGALILAEIERLDRLPAAPQQGGE